MPPKPRIAHLAGSNATIQNSPPLVTSNKAREKDGLPLVTNPDGSRYASTSSAPSAWLRR